MCKTGVTGKLLQEGVFRALGRELNLVLTGFALCRKLKGFEDGYGSSFPAGALCSGEETHSRVVGSAP